MDAVLDPVHSWLMPVHLNDDLVRNLFGCPVPRSADGPVIEVSILIGQGNVAHEGVDPVMRFEGNMNFREMNRIDAYIPRLVEGSLVASIEYGMVVDPSDVVGGLQELEWIKSQCRDDVDILELVLPVRQRFHELKRRSFAGSAPDSITGGDPGRRFFNTDKLAVVNLFPILHDDVLSLFYYFEDIRQADSSIAKSAFSYRQLSQFIGLTSMICLDYLNMASFKKSVNH
jgi:hypothetical protein